MKTTADGARLFTSDDVNLERVHAAMTAVGRRLTERRQAAMTGKPCTGMDARAHVPCGSEAVAVYVVGPRCPRHTPAAERGRDEPPRDRCQHPTRCYCPKHRDVALDENEHARAALAQREHAWQRAVVDDVRQLASLRTPFTLAQLVEHLPPARSPDRPVVEQALLALLAQGVERGLIVKHPTRNEWRGTQT